MNSPTADTIVIDRRFNGPPASANGGYMCGTVANLLGAGPAEVALRAPPPLDRPLTMRTAPGSVSILDGDTLVAEGHRLEALDLSPPATLSAEAGDAAAQRYPWSEEHPFPTCFVCGPKRPQRDGLEIFTGPAEMPDVYGSTWTPAAELADSTGDVQPQFVWAALDCPTGLVALTSGGLVPGVLGTLAASIDSPLRAGERHTITAWGLGVEGRKRSAAAVICGPDGQVRARSRALWIELRR